MKSTGELTRLSSRLTAAWRNMANRHRPEQRKERGYFSSAILAAVAPDQGNFAVTSPPQQSLALQLIEPESVEFRSNETN